MRSPARYTHWRDSDKEKKQNETEAKPTAIARLPVRPLDSDEVSSL